ncbi:MAG: hypothetical protein L6R42_008701, partial [Xanthoria sp. 1 TBL-2021]
MDPASPTYQDQLARWGDDREAELIAVSIILIIATCLATALRFWAQRSIKKQWEADNILIVFAASVYSLALLQAFCLGLIKLSILLFYRRIFTMHRRAFQIAFYVLGTYTLLLTIATFIVFLLQCVPISLFWDIAYRIEGVRPPHLAKGHCLPQQGQIIPTLIANTLSDVALMILPAIGLRNLSLPTAKKIGLFFVFSLGA